MLTPVTSFSTSSAACGLLPVPEEPQLTLPGFAFAYAISSFMSLGGNFGLTTAISGAEPM